MKRPAKANLQNLPNAPLGADLADSSGGALLLCGLFVGLLGTLSGLLGVLPASAQGTYRDYAGDDGGRIVRPEGGRGTGGRDGASGGLYGAQLVRPVLRYTEPAGTSGGFNSPTWSDCENNPGLRKNLEQFGRFIPAAIMGNDDRCPLSYAPNAPEIERQFYGVGALNYLANDGRCLGRNGKPCVSSGQLVIDRDIAIVSAHGFRDARTGARLSREEILKGFKFTVKVWVPPSVRYKSNEEFEFRDYDIEDVEFGGSSNEEIEKETDYAFIKLKRPVGELVGPADDNNYEDMSKALRVPTNRLIEPLPFRRFERSTVPNVVMTVGFQMDKGDDVQKNCTPFKLHSPPAGNPLANRRGMLIHDGDTNGAASGSALTVLVNGRPHFTAIHTGAWGSSNPHSGSFDPHSRFNYAVDGQSFYDRFVQFRRRFGRN